MLINIQVWVDQSRDMSARAEKEKTGPSETLAKFTWNSQMGLPFW